MMRVARTSQVVVVFSAIAWHPSRGADELPLEGSGGAFDWDSMEVRDPKMAQLALPGMFSEWPYTWPRAQPEQLWRLISRAGRGALFTAPDHFKMHEAARSAIPALRCVQDAMASLSRQVYKLGLAILQAEVDGISPEDVVRLTTGIQPHAAEFVDRYKTCMREESFDLSEDVEKAFGPLDDSTVRVQQDVQAVVQKSTNSVLNLLGLVRWEDRSDLGDHFMTAAGRVMGLSEQIAYIGTQALSAATLPAFLRDRAEWTNGWIRWNVSVFASEEMGIGPGPEVALPVFNVQGLVECCNRVEVITELLRSLGAAERPLRFVEIGVEMGWLSLTLLRLFPFLEVNGVDPYYWPEEELDEQGRLIREQLNLRCDSHYNVTSKEFARFPAERAKLYRLPSMGGVSRFEDRSVDLVFVDGQHTFKHTLKDIQMWEPKVRRGGILAGQERCMGEEDHHQ
mmetsp:Transcript_25330/g.84613  ORF Transcript_25330/g.84613 Transcript_25330/m.84613 type:complete len:453 (-) Transcript_25330:9-1367(-)